MPSAKNTVFLLYYLENPMPDAHTSLPARTEPIQKILERSALPLLLFAAVLFVLLFVSWFSILPRFTRFAVEDTLLAPTEMAAYVTHMKAELLAQEETRNGLIMPLREPSYDTLKKEKRAAMNAATLRRTLLDIGASVSQMKDAVAITHVSVEGSTVRVSGVVRNVGLRSMTVLASFVEAVGVLPFVADIERPSFNRVQNADGTAHSPFDMTLTLQTK